jgi:hypothetical protein
MRVRPRYGNAGADDEVLTLLGAVAQPALAQRLQSRVLDLAHVPAKWILKGVHARLRGL